MSRMRPAHDSTTSDAWVGGKPCGLCRQAACDMSRRNLRVLSLKGCSETSVACSRPSCSPAQVWRRGRPSGLVAPPAAAVAAALAASAFFFAAVIPSAARAASAATSPRTAAAPAAPPSPGALISKPPSSACSARVE